MYHGSPVIVIMAASLDPNQAGLVPQRVNDARIQEE
jgi:hypothetical protein